VQQGEITDGLHVRVVKPLQCAVLVERRRLAPQQCSLRLVFGSEKNVPHLVWHRPTAREKRSPQLAGRLPPRCEPDDILESPIAPAGHNSSKLRWPRRHAPITSFKWIRVPKGKPRVVRGCKPAFIAEAGTPQDHSIRIDQPALEFDFDTLNFSRRIPHENRQADNAFLTTESQQRIVQSRIEAELPTKCKSV